MDNEVWIMVKDQNLLHTHSCPKNLIEDEKAARRKWTAIHCWSKNESRYLENQCKIRQQKREAFEMASKLTTIYKAKSDQVKALQTATGTVVATLYDKHPSLKDWIGQDL